MTSNRNAPVAVVSLYSSVEIPLLTTYQCDLLSVTQPYQIKDIVIKNPQYVVVESLISANKGQSRNQSLNIRVSCSLTFENHVVLSHEFHHLCVVELHQDY